jgi:hypothetical protein
VTAEVDALYALPLDEFTKARDALAKSERDPSIRKLRKPSAAAWALNQAAREHKGDVARFLHAAAALREAPSRSALDDLRAAEADVRRAALAHLGSRADAQLATVNELLGAAASSEAVAETLRAGTLTGTEEPGELSLGQGAIDNRQEDEVRKARERKQRQREEAEAAVAKAEQEADRLEQVAADMEEHAAKARGHADEARAEAERLRAAVPT